MKSLDDEEEGNEEDEFYDDDEDPLARGLPLGHGNGNGYHSTTPQPPVHQQPANERPRQPESDNIIGKFKHLNPHYPQFMTQKTISFFQHHLLVNSRANDIEHMTNSPPVQMDALNVFA